MSLTMYQASVPVFVQHLNGLAGSLEKAAAFATAKKIEPAVLLGARIYPDMYPLWRQVREATNHAVNCTAKLAGVDAPKLPESETSIDELKARVAAAIAFLNTIKPQQVDGTEDKTVTMQFGPNTREFKGQGFLLGFALPNFFFHATTAYNLLRQYGIEIGKRDFMGPR